jgi:methylated-DNA-[protein]-cysteine S-methyltransferase
MHAIAFRPSPFGRIGLEETDGAIVRLYLAVDSSSLAMDAVYRETDLLRRAFAQLEAYWQGELRVFDLPLAPQGTEFMRQVWRQLCAVPYGQTATYRDIAAAVGNPKACRAVGLANHRNPIPIFIPCHRIVGRNGALTGYRGGLDMKRALLDLEAGRTVLRA